MFAFSRENPSKNWLILLNGLVFFGGLGLACLTHFIFERKKVPFKTVSDFMTIEDFEKKVKSGL